MRSVSIGADWRKTYHGILRFNAIFTEHLLNAFRSDAGWERAAPNAPAPELPNHARALPFTQCLCQINNCGAILKNAALPGILSAISIFIDGDAFGWSTCVLHHSTLTFIFTTLVALPWLTPLPSWLILRSMGSSRRPLGSGGKSIRALSL